MCLWICAAGASMRVCTCISLVVLQIADTNYISASAIYLCKCVCVLVCVRHPYMTIHSENYFFFSMLDVSLHSFFSPLSSSLQVCSVPRYCKTYLHSQPGWIPWEPHSRPACCLDRDKRCFVCWPILPLSSFGSVFLLLLLGHSFCLSISLFAV